MKRKPIVGETLFSLNIGNAARYRPQELTLVIVSKVGRKYFTVREGYKAKEFHLSTWEEKTEYAPNHKLYESEQEWLDEAEIKQICEQIYRAFEYGKNKKQLPISALREIERLIQEKQ